MIKKATGHGYPFRNIPGLFADLIVSDTLWTLKGAVHPSREFDIQAMVPPIDKVMLKIEKAQSLEETKSPFSPISPSYLKSTLQHMKRYLASFMTFRRLRSHFTFGLKSKRPWKLVIQVQPVISSA